jgi:3-hydroxyacyl-[acyl-carrier-protein] dehydratase
VLVRWVFLSRIDELVPGEVVRGRTSFSPDLELFQDHFPQWPVVPGVLLLEALAQLAGKGIGYTVRLNRGDWPVPILSMIHAAKFRRFVRPGQEVELEATFDALRDESAAMKVRARHEGKVVAQAEQVFVFNAVPFENPEHGRLLEETEGAELARLWSGFDPSVWRR